MMFPSAQKLILDVLKLNQPYHSNVRNIIQLGDVFDISENTMRVTLTRLCRSGLIDSPKRGFYKITPKATEVEQELWNWRQRQDIVQDWHGDYVMLSCEKTPQQDSITHKKNQKYLKLMGFAVFERSLYIRPNNLVYPPNTIKEKLIKLGITTPFTIFIAQGFELGDEQLIQKLWQPAQINQYYIEHTHKMRHWMMHQHLYSQRQLIQESYLICQDAIRHIFFDPLLPEPYIITQKRQDFLEMTIRFEHNGINLWRDYCNNRKPADRTSNTYY
jgi:phenylacetic acid degradation operon negative regulatory protein